MRFNLLHYTKCLNSSFYKKSIFLTISGDTLNHVATEH